MENLALYRLTDKSKVLGSKLDELYSSLENRNADENIMSIKNHLDLNNNRSIFGDDDLGTFIIRKLLDESKLSSSATSFIIDCLHNEIFYNGIADNNNPGSRLPFTKPLPNHIKDGFLYNMNNMEDSNLTQCYGMNKFYDTDFESLVEEDLVEKVSSDELYGYMLEELTSDYFGHDLSLLQSLYEKSIGKGPHSIHNCDGYPSLLGWKLFNPHLNKDCPIIELISTGVNIVNFIVEPILDKESVVEVSKKIENFKTLFPYLKEDGVDFVVDLEIAIKGGTEFQTDKLALLEFFDLNYFSEGFNKLEKYLRNKLNLD